MPEEIARKPRIKISWFIWTVLAFLIFVVIATYSSRMAHNYRDYDQQRVADRYSALKKLRQTEHETLATADWVDQTKGLVRIPIDEAMAKEIDTLKNKPAAMGSLIPTTAPAPATTNAAPAAPAASAGATNAAPAAPATPPKETK